MSLSIRAADRGNRAALEALRVAPGQEGYIETVAQCLREADGLALWRPLGLYDGETPVGFAMVGRFPGEVWLDRLLIEGRYQGRGLGGEALVLLLRYLREQYGPGPVYLSLYPENTAALALYEKHGFRLNGERDIHGELVMVREAD